MSSTDSVALLRRCQNPAADVVELSAIRATSPLVWLCWKEATRAMIAFRVSSKANVQYSSAKPKNRIKANSSLAALVPLSRGEKGTLLPEIKTDGDNCLRSNCASPLSGFSTAASNRSVNPSEVLNSWNAAIGAESVRTKALITRALSDLIFTLCKYISNF